MRMSLASCMGPGSRLWGSDSCDTTTSNSTDMGCLLSLPAHNRSLKAYTCRVTTCMVSPMGDSQRLNVTLDQERAAKLSRLAARVHVTQGTLARSLLSN